MIDPTRMARLAALEQQYGLPRSTLAGMYGIESNFGRAKDRPGSQFQGGFQLGNAVRRQYGINNPQDFEQSAMGAALYARDNANYLRKTLGRDPGASDLYLAHQQGPGGAAKLLSHPNVPAGMLTNPEFIRANSGDPNAPASQFASKFSSMFADKAKLAEMVDPSGPPMAFAMNDKTTGQTRSDALNAINSMADPSGFMMGGQGGMGAEEEQPSGWDAMGNIGNGLTAAGAALMAIDNPSGAQALMSGIRAQQRLRKSPWNNIGMTADQTGVIMMNEQDPSQVRITPIPGATPKSNLQYKGIDTDKDGNSFDTFVNPNTGELVRKPTTMQDPAFKQRQQMDDETNKFWAGQVMQDPDLLNKVPKEVRPGVMKEITKEAQEAGFTSLKDVRQENIAAITDYKRRSQIIAQMDTFKGEALAAAEQLNRFSQELPREFQVMPIEQLNQWLVTKGAANSELAQKIVAYKAAREGFTRSVNRAFTVGSGGNVSGEQRVLQLMPDGASHEQIKAAIQPLANDVIRMNNYAQWALDNRKAKNAGKPLPHPEIDDEKAWMEKNFPSPTKAQSSPQEAPKQTQAPEGMPSGARQDASGVWWAPQPNGKWRKVITQP